MKQLHRKDLFGWSEFNKERNLDFHSVLWVRDGGNVLIDPLPMSEHDHSHLQRLGGVNFIVITNSDHCRDAEILQVVQVPRFMVHQAKKIPFLFLVNAGFMIMKKSFLD